jgi:hypothetical protein
VSNRVPPRRRPRWQPSPTAREQEIRHRLDDFDQALAIRGAAANSAATEAKARADLGMPASHPESLTAELPEAQEEWLAAAAADLWKQDEWMQITAETRREGP